MTNEQRKEDKTYNELIAEFMGLQKVSVGYFGDDDETDWQTENREWMDKVDMNSVGEYVVDVKNDYWKEWERVKYHKSWDWLMPVVEKIEGLGYQFWIGKFGIAVSKPKMDEFQINTKGETKIQNVYKAVVEFIKYWNSQAEYKR